MKVKSYAKINIGLNILYKRFDGFHELESIMVLVDLHDDIEFNILENKEIECSSNLSFLNNKNNLIYKIAEFLQEEYKVEKGISIHLDKNIPVSGGMGGGSSNAAVTILTLNKLWELNLSEKEMLDIGYKFGADIPFCINQTPAVIKGVGEIIEPFNFEDDFDVIVVKMPFGLSTKVVFNSFESSFLEQYSISNIKKALINKNRNDFLDSIGNNLEEVSIGLKPRIKEVKDILDHNGCFHSIMSGSGPTVLGFIEKDSDSSDLIKLLKCNGYEAYHTKIIHEKYI